MAETKSKSEEKRLKAQTEELKPIVKEVVKEVVKPEEVKPEVKPASNAIHLNTALFMIYLMHKTNIITNRNVKDLILASAKVPDDLMEEIKKIIVVI